MGAIEIEVKEWLFNLINAQVVVQEFLLSRTYKSFAVITV